MTNKRKILFLCTGNSCRSQMAEAIVNARYGETWEAVSAGTQPTGYVHPIAIAVLKEIGIDHEGVSKNTDQFKGIEFDLVVTVCDDATENCPLWLGKGKRVHMGFSDPAKAEAAKKRSWQSSALHEMICSRIFLDYFQENFSKNKRGVTRSPGGVGCLIL